jgi:hypothetical protein
MKSCTPALAGLMYFSIPTNSVGAEADNGVYNNVITDKCQNLADAKTNNLCEFYLNAVNGSLF